MIEKKYQKQIIFGIGAVAIVIFAVVLARAMLYSPTQDLTVPTAADASAPIGQPSDPVRLAIPALHIDTKVQYVGLTSSGKMAVPDNFTDVGWYKYGTIPGQTGSAVIAGHVDDGLSLPGVFKHLDQLKVGDDIYITTQDNQTLHFVMTGSQAYPKDAATDQIFNQKDGQLLRLITCTGTWLPDQRTHDQRLVVTAILKK